MPNPTSQPNKLFLIAAAAAAVLFAYGLTSGAQLAVGIGLVGGLVALALSVLKSTGAILAPIIFSTVMNVTGSMLASYWRDRPPAEETAA